MKRHLCHIVLLASAAFAAPAALADGIIVKCIDASGRVTLTDQPCAPGVATVRVASMPSNAGVSRAAPYPLAAAEASLPTARELQRRALPERAARVVAKPMEGDVATLKAARAQFLLGDASARPALAGLE